MNPLTHPIIQAIKARIVLHQIVCGVLILGYLCPGVSDAQESDALNAEFDELTKEVLVQYHTNLAIAENTSLRDPADLEKLLRQNRGAAGALLKFIASNQENLLQNNDPSLLLEAFQALLDANLGGIAQHLLTKAESVSDTYTLSQLHYLIAVYFHRTGQPERALQHLSKIEARNALSEKQSDYATLLFGTLLQDNKKHREAVKYYQTIAPESAYFSQAQMNIAVAYIRQGWWTDAQLAINNALSSDAVNSDPELRNRLLLMLGYNRLKNEFYRDSREAFRKISLESSYSNRAMLGIGLCALNQGDIVGAINAFGYLKKKNENTISVTEAHLLYAYAHEKTGESALASAQYEAAIAYYNGRLLAVGDDDKPLDPGITFEYTEANRDLVEQRVQILERLAAVFPTNNQRLLALRDRFRIYLQKIKEGTKNDNIRILTSYLSQSQYGQAKLFDNKP
ncbi:tetratricopeptide repeat protein [Teredinibacter turnerae]|uniref:tetratricopeptide repeat protein n=1 Tax=Teredinibacter turnerae TaxID=2426 RepID=UPI00037E6CBF|nr:tetratricopeptide repeat protein [Teredinibacter turnerae]